ncbi:MAG TPA: hypothetical protein G4N97_00585 [Thermoflexia bacterium]|nr:hypothetical protein [Thermoflexia bacterium]
MAKVGIYTWRTQVSFTPQQREKIERICRRENISMSEFVRHSVEYYLQVRERQRRQIQEALRASAGAWKDRDFTGIEYEDAIRREAEERLQREIGSARLSD